MVGTGNGPGDIYYRRLSPQGVPFAQGPVLVSLDLDGSSDDRLSDVGDGYIVYTALDPASTSTGIIRLYDILSGGTVDLMPSPDVVQEARIHGSIVAWYREVRSPRESRW